MFRYVLHTGITLRCKAGTAAESKLHFSQAMQPCMSYISWSPLPACCCCLFTYSKDHSALLNSTVHNKMHVVMLRHLRYYYPDEDTIRQSAYVHQTQQPTLQHFTTRVIKIWTACWFLCWKSQNIDLVCAESATDAIHTIMHSCLLHAQVDKHAHACKSNTHSCSRVSQEHWQFVLTTAPNHLLATAVMWRN